MKIVNELGLHARAAAKVVSIANEFKSDITLKKDKKNADAKSIMKILMLSASKGASVDIIVDGSYLNEAMDAVVKLFKNGFDERL